MTFSPRETDEAPTVNATRARQGRWGRPIVWVLVFGTLLSALGMLAAWQWGTDSTVPVAQGNERVDGSQTSDTPAPPPPTPPSNDAR